MKRRLVVSGLLLVVAGLTAVAAYDRLTAPGYDHRPLHAPSALDEWTPPWPEGTEACSGRPERWLVVGWDGADWDLVLPLLEAGEMPRLEALMRNGTSATLASFLPSISPALWTTVATGVSPERHGIRGFYKRRPLLHRWLDRLLHLGRLERRLYSNADRRVKAAWNVLSEEGRRVLLAGYHNTFPVEPVEGVMVSNYLVQDAIGELMEMRAGTEAGSPFAASLVYPPSRLDEVLSLHRRVHREAVERVEDFAAVPPEELRSFLGRARRLDRDGDVRPYFLLRALTYDTLNARVAERFLPEADPAVTFVHFQALDWAAHHFLYFHRPEAYADVEWPPEVRRRLERQLPRYRPTVAAFHRDLDAWLGKLIDAAGPEATVLVLSDHGVHPTSDPEVPGFHDDGPPGILVLSGPGVRRGHRLEGPTLYDVLPTLMASLGLPVAEDLEGRVLEEAFCPGAADGWPTVASYETTERYVPEVARPEELDAEVLRQLESLGYLD